MSIASDAPPQPHEPGPSLLVSIGVIVIAAAIGITGLAVGITSAVHRVQHFENGPHGILPATISAQLTPATWQVYVEDDEGLIPEVNLNASDVTVTASDGTSIPVRDMPGNFSETESTGNHLYDAVVRFDISTADTYTIRARSDLEGAGTEILVGKSFGSQFSGLITWFVMAGFGFLLGVVGVVLLIVGIARRRGARRRFAYGGLSSPGPGTGGGYYPTGTTTYGPTQPAPSAPAALPPPGWFADPHLPGMQRYWDGTRWTDQTRNIT